MKEKLPINPWLKIWISPRNTIRNIIAFNPSYLFYLLSGIYGFITLLQLAQDFSLGSQFSLLIILGASLVLSAPIGALLFNIFAALICWAGRWIGGKGSFSHIKAAIAWSYVPSLVNVAVWFLLMGVFGEQIFASSFADTAFAGYQLSVVFFGFLAQIIASIWSFFIALQTLAEVQAFSAWKAFLNIVIPGLMLFAAFWFISWIFYRVMSTPVLN